MKAQLALEFLGVLLLLMFAAAASITFAVDFAGALDRELASLSDEVAVEAVAIRISSTAVLGEPFLETSLPVRKGMYAEGNNLILNNATAEVVGAIDLELTGDEIEYETYKLKT